MLVGNCRLGVGIDQVGVPGSWEIAGTGKVVGLIACSMQMRIKEVAVLLY